MHAYISTVTITDSYMNRLLWNHFRHDAVQGLIIIHLYKQATCDVHATSSLVLPVQLPQLSAGGFLEP